MEKKTLIKHRRNQPFCALLVGVIVLLCMSLVDRPLALWIDTHVQGTAIYALSAAALRVIGAIMPVVAVLLVIAVIWKRRHPSAPRWLARFIAAGCAGMLALVVTELLKFVVGRSQVSPPFIRDHVYAFRPFSRDLDFWSFPSATMSIATALLAGSGLRTLLLRAAAVLVIIGIAVAILAVHGHWLSDVIAGAWLGSIIGLSMAHRSRLTSTPDREV